MLLEAIRHNALHCGGRPAYRCSGAFLSYRQLWRGARRLADRLRAQGSAPVLVWGHKEPWVPLAFLACLLAGRAYVPCDSSCPPARAQGVCRQAGARLALACAPAPPPFGVPVWQLAAEGGAAQANAGGPLAGLPSWPLPPDRAAYILFTSGSSGQPKGVRVTLANLEHFTAWFLALPAMAETAGGVCVNQALFSFDLSVADLYPTWAAGGTLFALDAACQQSYLQLYAALAASGGRRLTATPAFLRLCLRDPAFCAQLMPQLGAVFCCGDLLPPKTAAALQLRFPGLRVLNAYGPTEATCAVCAAELASPLPPGPCPVGEAARAAAGLCILSEAGRALPEGRAGEICLTGPSVAAGYLGGEQGGFCTLNGAPAYRTGDRGMIKNGYLWFLGRKDRQIKYKGYRVEPAELEAALLALPAVRHAAALPLFGPGGAVAGLAAFVEWAGPPLDPAALQKQLALTLPAYLLPRRVLPLEAMPFTPAGKPDLRALKEFL